MTPAILVACADYVATLAKARELEAEARSIEANGLARLGEAMRTLASTDAVDKHGAKPMTPEQFAKAHDMSKSLVYRKMADGTLPYTKLSPRKREIDEEQALAALRDARASVFEAEDAPLRKCGPDERAVKRAALRALGGRLQASR